MIQNTENLTPQTSSEKATNLLLQFLTDCKELGIQYSPSIIGGLMQQLVEETYRLRSHGSQLIHDPESLFDRIASCKTPPPPGYKPFSFEEKNQKQE